MCLPTGARYMLAIILFWLLCNLSCIAFALLWGKWGGLQAEKEEEITHTKVLPYG